MLLHDSAQLGRIPGDSGKDDEAVFRLLHQDSSRTVGHPFPLDTVQFRKTPSISSPPQLASSGTHFLTAELLAHQAPEAVPNDAPEAIRIPYQMASITNETSTVATTVVPPRSPPPHCAGSHKRPRGTEGEPECPEAPADGPRFVAAVAPFRPPSVEGTFLDQSLLADSADSPMLGQDALDRALGQIDITTVDDADLAALGRRLSGGESLFGAWSD